MVISCGLPLLLLYLLCCFFRPQQWEVFTLRPGRCPTGKGQPLPAIPRPEHTEPLRVGQPQPRAQAARLQVAPQLSLFILTLPLYWWILRVLLFSSQNYGLMSQESLSPMSINTTVDVQKVVLTLISSFLGICNTLS